MNFFVHSTLKSAPINYPLLISLSLSIFNSSCALPPDSDNSSPITPVPHISLGVPVPEGWTVDSSVKLADPAKGGAYFSLIRNSREPGSPRLEFSLTPLTTSTPSLNQLAQSASNHMKNLRKESGFTSVNNNKKQTTIAGNKAIRLEQSYTLGSKSTEVAVTQFSIITVVEKRGLFITAAGRTELFTPLASEIETILSGTK